MIKQCEICRKSFNARLAKVRTCGRVCGNALIAREKVDRHALCKQCVVCGDSFEARSNHERKRATCSSSCQYKLTGSKTSRSLACSCQTCGKEFNAIPSELAKEAGKYCSKACLYDRNKVAMTRNCIECGTAFSTPPSHAHVQTCSTECGYRHFSGERRANYKGHTYVAVIDGRRISRRHQWASNEHRTARARAIGLATPKWADRDAMKQIYRQSSLLSATGTKYHVDHIIPLKSPVVCGLHCEANLRVIPAIDNIRKHNHF